MNLPLEKQVCSLELAKELKELGVKQESLFSYVDDMLVFKTDIGCYSKSGAGVNPRYLSEHNLTAAYTTAEVGEKLPKQINVGTHSVSYWGWCSRYVGDQWEVYFDSYLGIAEAPKCKNFRERTEADARAKMLIYLLKNGYAKAEDL